MMTDDEIRIKVYENLRHSTSRALHDASDSIERRIFEIEYDRYGDLIRMIKETA